MWRREELWGGIAQWHTLSTLGSTPRHYQSPQMKRERTDDYQVEILLEVSMRPPRSHTFSRPKISILFQSFTHGMCSLFFRKYIVGYSQ